MYSHKKRATTHRRVVQNRNELVVEGRDIMVVCTHVYTTKYFAIYRKQRERAGKTDVLHCFLPKGRADVRIRTYPKPDDDDKHLEKHAKHVVARERHRHDSNECRSSSDDHRRPYLPEPVRYSNILRGVRVLRRTEKTTKNVPRHLLTQLARWMSNRSLYVRWKASKKYFAANRCVFRGVSGVFIAKEQEGGADVWVVFSSPYILLRRSQHAYTSQ